MALDPPMTEDQGKGSLQRLALALWNRLLDVGTEDDTWWQYLEARGYEQTVISIANGAGTAGTHPNNPTG